MNKCFVIVHSCEGIEYVVNLRLVRYLMPLGNRTLIQFERQIVCSNDMSDEWYQFLNSEDELSVIESYDEILRQVE